MTDDELIARLPRLLHGTPEQVAANIREHVRHRRILGWDVVVVPLALMGSRTAARVAIGTMLAPKDKCLIDLRARTLPDLGPCWIMAAHLEHSS